LREALGVFFLRAELFARPIRLKITEETESKLRNYDMGYYYTFWAGRRLQESSTGLFYVFQWFADALT
jgi:hypothetical protein